MELNVSTRTILGKKVKSLRKDGVIPAELYGDGIQNKHIQIGEKDFMKLYRAGAEHGVVTVVIDAKEKVPALISDVERHPLSNKILTVDLHQVRMDEKIRTTIPLTFTDESPAGKNGFLVVTVLNEIEIESLPNAIPSHIEVSVASLETGGQSIHAGDITMPKGVLCITPHEAVIVTVTEKRKAEEAPEPAPAAEGAAPEAKTEATEEKAAE